ncbi:hypothetical protein [Dyadobacter sp. CY347]|uniref:hypothetical protein n=1 Tax=Dyadobacter sp. CY347 TaxID=2909336 RepID=UPI001F41A9C9|nr:hypothetical protein [Dyadobacter sp. CY347]MCF2491466.1 hypothetical protein [Dyadobacter sp. CY347]
MLTIALIDRFPIVLMGTKLTIKKSLQGVRILAANDIFSFQAQNPDCKPDIFIVGIAREVVVDPFHLIPAIKKVFKCPVIVYDDLPANQICIKYFSAGASGYVSKCSPASELIKCINEIRKNKIYMTIEALHSMIENIPAGFTY